MSHGEHHVGLSDIARIVTAEPVKLSTAAKGVLGALVAAGFVCFAILMKQDARYAWAALHVNILYWLVICCASTGFAAVFHICDAKWARPLKRIFESASVMLIPLLALFAVVYLAGAYTHIFSWSTDTSDLVRRPTMFGPWYSQSYVFFRDLIALAILIFCLKRVVNYGLRQDIGAIRSGLTGLEDNKVSRWFDASLTKHVSGWGSNPKEEILNASHRKGRLSPVVVIVYAFAIALIAFDQIMSVDPHWFSTLFGAFVFMSGVYSAVAWNSMAVGVLREMHPVFKQHVRKKTLWDLGKLLFGFGIFWTYLFWSHYLTIWYGNMPEETGWLITRTRNEPWHGFSWFVLWGSFFCPFLLGLSRDVKQVPLLLFCTGAIVAIGQWCLFYDLVIPTLYPNVIPLGYADVGLAAGFIAAFALGVSYYLGRYPLIPVGDLYAPLPEPEYVAGAR